MGGSSSEVRRKGETKAEMFERFGQGDKVKERPELPEGAEHVVVWFFYISRRRGSGMGGGLPLTFHDITAWKELLQESPTQEEVAMILAMDDAYMQAINAGDEPEPDEAPTSILLRKP